MATMAFSQGSVWFTFACVSPHTVHKYIPSATQDIVRWLMMLGPFGLIAGIPIVSSVAARPNGLRLCIHIGFLLSAISISVLMLLLFPAIRGSSSASLAVLFAGLIINGFVGPVALCLPPMMAAEWFPQHQRGRAVATVYVACGSATIVWAPLGPVLGNIPLLLYARLATISVPALACLFYFPKTSPTPENDDCAAINVLLPESKPPYHRSQYLSVVILGGLQCGIVGAFQSFLQDELQHSFSSGFLGWLGLAMSAASLPGTLLAGVVNDTKFGRAHHHHIAALYFIPQLIVLVLFFRKLCTRLPPLHSYRP